MGRVHHDFAGGNPRSGFREHQALRENGAQVLRKIEENLIVLVAREHVDDAIQGFGAIVGVQGRDAKMSRTGQRNGGLHGFAVANFADQNHVGRGAYRAAQGARKTLGIQTHFALIDDGFLIAVQELDRILDGQDVIG